MSSPRVTAVLTGSQRDGSALIGVVAKRTYDVAGGRCRPADLQIPLAEDVAYDETGLVLEHDTDLALQRRHADLVVHGHAYGYGESRGEIEIKVDRFDRRIALFGERRLRFDAGRIRFGSPARFERIPLRWEHAYGGVDHATREAWGDPIAEFQHESGEAPNPGFGLYGYPRNPAGTGYLIEPTPAAVDACVLPNFEEPRQLLSPDNVARDDFLRWPTGPLPAATGYLPHHYFPRMAQLGLPLAPYNDAEIAPQRFVEVAAGILGARSVSHDAPLPERLDIGVAQQSAVGMRADSIAPGAPVSLGRLHPREKLWRFRLPDQAPRLAYRISGYEAVELEARIKTLLIEPDLDRVTIVWVGEKTVPPPALPHMAETQHAAVWR